MSLLNAIIAQTEDRLPFLQNMQYVTNANKIHYSLGLPQAQYNPAMYNSDGVSIFAVLGNTESDNEQFMYKFNHNSGVLENPVSWGTYPTGNYHTIATTLILPSKRVLTATSKIHNEIVTIKRSNNALDLTSHTELVELDFGTLRPAYFTMTLIGSRVYATFREDWINQYITYSDDEGETWSTPLKTVGLDADNWAYPRNIFSETEIITIINQREGSGGSYSKAYLIRSTDGITFTNIDGTFSKNISVSGHLTEAELTANCQVGTDIGVVSGGIQADDGTIWIHNIEYSTDKTYLWHSDRTTDFVRKTLIFDDYTNINVSRLAMINPIENNYTFFVGGTRDTDVYVLLKVSTADSFNTFTVEEFKNPRSYNPVMGHNYQQTKQTPLVLLEQTSYDYGAIHEPVNSYSNLWLYD